MQKSNVSCRPALAADKQGMLELTRNIWEGKDYVPLVWDEWLADPHGSLAAAEIDGVMVGLGKLSRLSPDDWWLEGLRVHPEFEGKGIASALHDYLLDVWENIGEGTIRLLTASFRLAVHHLCERSGFHKLGEFTPFIAQSLDSGWTDISPSTFQPVRPEEITQAVGFALQSASIDYSYGLMDLGWQMAPPRDVFLLQSIKAGRLWWWQDKQGLLATFEDDDDQRGKTPMIGLLACPTDKIAELLLDFRRLAKAQSYPHAAWNAPLQDDLLPHLEAAEFNRDWDDAIYIFARRHSGGSKA